MSDKSKSDLAGMPENDGTRATAATFIDAKRRGFLQGAVLAGGAAASGASLAHHGGDHTVEAAVEKPAASGYRETDHVRDYYAAARF